MNIVLKRQLTEGVIHIGFMLVQNKNSMLFIPVGTRDEPLLKPLYS